MNKFDEVYNKIITEMADYNKKAIVSEDFMGKVKGLFKGAKGKHKMMKSTIVRWMNANNFSQNGGENKFISKLPNGYTLKFTFSDKSWFNPESKEIKYGIYLRDTEGNLKPLTEKSGIIKYSYSENDIRKELSKKLKDAMPEEDAKAFKTKKEVDKKIRADRQAEADAAAQKKDEEETKE